MRFVSLFSITPLEASLNLFHFITKNFWKLCILHVIIRNKVENGLGEGKSSGHVGQWCFQLLNLILHFPNDMIKLSSSSPPWGNVGSYIFTQTSSWCVTSIMNNIISKLLIDVLLEENLSLLSVNLLAWSLTKKIQTITTRKLTVSDSFIKVL
jgi:hypothetical protein